MSDLLYLYHLRLQYFYIKFQSQYRTAGIFTYFTTDSYRQKFKVSFHVNDYYYTSIDGMAIFTALMKPNKFHEMLLQYIGSLAWRKLSPMNFFYSTMPSLLYTLHNACLCSYVAASSCKPDPLTGKTLRKGMVYITWR